jgi:hypothetical protein
MELDEFLEKFLPDYEGKSIQFFNDNYNLKDDRRNLLLYDRYFSEALQNFADRICEKQRENCIESIDKFCCCRYIEEVEEYIVKGTIKSCDQPKIDEL